MFSLFSLTKINIVSPHSGPHSLTKKINKSRSLRSTSPHIALFISSMFFLIYDKINIPCMFQARQGCKSLNSPVRCN